ncbi:outer membrane beta-barrel protein [Treponema brennaborense]|uniref:Outer membrane protein beta-barrel domain-containing protein n=1 Tax=Treponema brennaborense (strain DSM 12168 / CIP 105900 / DD5/3) TaxID=906968 RepID=F4LN23_TREBD|nr:outer membrane beta-barrel protein [Treponema brennaborense]AEE15809.1 hypothetical protein Trebr_0362 [Treponema brennaborense DSM 12168]
MKKVYVIIFTLFTVIWSGSALTFGIRGGVSYGLGTSWSDFGANFSGNFSVRDDIPIGGNIAVYSAFPVNGFLFFQPEFSFMINNGMGVSIKESGLSTSMQLKYSSLDIPILVGFSFHSFNKMRLCFLGGLYLSFPLGEMEVSTSSDGKTERVAISSGLIWGVTGGISSVIPFKTGAFIVDLRYLSDFRSIEVAYISMFTRRTFVLSVGYEFRF